MKAGGARTANTSSATKMMSSAVTAPPAGSNSRCCQTQYWRSTKSHGLPNLRWLTQLDTRLVRLPMVITVQMRAAEITRVQHQPGVVFDRDRMIQRPGSWMREF